MFTRNKDFIITALLNAFAVCCKFYYYAELLKEIAVCFGFSYQIYFSFHIICHFKFLHYAE